MKIGQLAKQADVNIQTIRFYERKGLVMPAGRTASGHRRYTPESVRRIRFIKHAQEIGFSLREIDELLSLRVDPETTCADVETRTEAKLVEVERKIEKLREMRRALESLVAQCQGSGPVSECAIIEALDELNGITV